MSVPQYVKVSNTMPQEELRFITLLRPGTESVWENKPSAAIEREDGRTRRVRITYGVKGKATVSR